MADAPPKTEKSKTHKHPEGRLPLLPLRNIVVYQGMVVPLFVGRKASIRGLDVAMETGQEVLLVAQKNGDEDNPAPDQLYDIGTYARVLQLLKMPDNTVKVLVEGLKRVTLSNITEEAGDYYIADYQTVPDTGSTKSDEIDSLVDLVRETFGKYARHKKLSSEVRTAIGNQKKVPAKIVDTVAVHLDVDLSEKQKLLAEPNISARLGMVIDIMDQGLSVLQVEGKIRGRVKKQMEKTQREYYLNEQLKAIQKELGESEDGGDELSELEADIKRIRLSTEARDKALSELKKLRQMSPMSAEATVVRNYLDWLLAVPWKKRGRIKKDLSWAEKVLNDDHYALDKVKERILEYLAVQQRTNKLRGPIICLVGPPGVGKTSLGKSIARATGREFVRMSLGGVRDESEIRGHRRTYIGSMPGRVIQSMKKVKTCNPLMLLDEIDKLGMDYRGDPASALLEVLDPEQNHSFNDHYMEVDYDLSNVMFVTTANSFNIPPPLLDRMEIIRIAGYTDDEKIEIAKRHLLPKIITEHGLKKGEFGVDESGLRQLIRYYTREAGVRNLAREIASLARKATTKIVRGEVKRVKIGTKNIVDFLGVRRYRFGLAERSHQVGVVTGLAWTEVGGELLTIEGVMLPGKGKMMTTGKLGDVMKESIDAASSYVRTCAARFGIEPPLFDRKDIHVHVPEGATPKDGPSAGTAMATAIISVMTKIPVRKDIAMTGEITLRGRVLPIGGLKEKLLAALRGGIRTVLIPVDNEKDIAEIPENIKEELEIIPVKNMDEVLTHALVKSPTAIEWDDEAYYAAQKTQSLATKTHH